MMIKAHLNSGKKNIFGYDASGERVDLIRRNSGGTILDSSRIFILGIDSKVIAEYIYVSGQWKIDHYSLYANEMVGKFVPTTGNNGTRYYYEKDHLGSVRVIVNESKNIESWTDFYPYGKISREGNSLNEPKDGFTGYIHDDESNLEYAGARYYNVDIGRFNITDRFTDKYPSWSPYHYGKNNPIRFIDINGDSVITNKLTTEQKHAFDKSQHELKKSTKYEKAWATLEVSKANYNIIINPNQSVGALYTLNSEGTGTGGTLSFQSIEAMNDYFNLSHEVYHAYEHDQGWPGLVVGVEIEANLFGNAVVNELFDAGVNGRTTGYLSTGEFGVAFNQLQYDPTFNTNAWLKANETFKKSDFNQDGRYNGYNLKYYDPLIKNFYPLVR